MVFKLQLEFARAIDGGPCHQLFAVQKENIDVVGRRLRGDERTELCSRGGVAGVEHPDAEIACGGVEQRADGGQLFRAVAFGDDGVVRA